MVVTCIVQPKCNANSNKNYCKVRVFFAFQIKETTLEIAGKSVKFHRKKKQQTENKTAIPAASVTPDLVAVTGEMSALATRVASHVRVKARGTSATPAAGEGHAASHAVPGNLSAEKRQSFSHSPSLSHSQRFLHSIHVSDGFLSIFLVLEDNKCKAWRVLGHPNLNQRPKLSKDFLEFTLGRIQSKVSDIHTEPIIIRAAATAVATASAAAAASAIAAPALTATATSAAWSSHYNWLVILHLEISRSESKSSSLFTHSESTYSSRISWHHSASNS